MKTPDFILGKNNHSSNNFSIMESKGSWAIKPKLHDMIRKGFDQCESGEKIIKDKSLPIVINNKYSSAVWLSTKNKKNSHLAFFDPQKVSYNSEETMAVLYKKHYNSFFETVGWAKSVLLEDEKKLIQK